MIIVDTNILIYLYIQGDHTSAAEELLNIDSVWVAPLLWRSEFKNVLALYLRKNIITLKQAFDITKQAESLMEDNEYLPSSALVLELVNSSKCSAYDCEFVSLAKQFNVKLITQDKKILSEFSSYAAQLEKFLQQHN